MVGRKRKVARRLPNGRIFEEPQSIPAVNRRVLELARRRALDPMLGSALGRMVLDRQITEVVFSAGCLYNELKRTVDAIMGFPPCARAQDIERMGGRSTEAGEPSQRDIDAIDKYDKARGVLTPQERSAIEWIVCDDRHPEGYAQRLYMTAGLTRLAMIWGMSR